MTPLWTLGRAAPRLATRNAAFSNYITPVALNARLTVKRGYTSSPPKAAGGNGPLLWIGLMSLGGAISYYHNKSNAVKLEAKPQKLSKDNHKEDTTVNVEGKKKVVDYVQVYNDIANLLDKDSDYDDGSYGPVLVRLAWHTSGTFSNSDKTGGSNYGTMRFKAEVSREANNGLKIASDLLEKEIHPKHPEISTGDLYTLAGVCAIQELGGPDIPWRPGRRDGGEQKLTPDGRLPDGGKGSSHIRDIFYRMGFNDQEIVALLGAHVLGRCHADRSGFEGPWQEAPTVFSNDYYKVIAEREWVKKKLANGGWQWSDKNNPEVMMLPAEIDMFNDKSFRKYFELYAKDSDKFYADFAKVFQKLLELGVPFSGDEKVYVFERVNA